MPCGIIASIIRADIDSFQVFAKLANYTGPSLKNLIAPPDSTKEDSRMVYEQIDKA